jgi:hypothetical protein
MSLQPIGHVEKYVWHKRASWRPPAVLSLRCRRRSCRNITPCKHIFYLSKSVNRRWRYILYCFRVHTSGMHESRRFLYGSGSFSDYEQWNFKLVEIIRTAEVGWHLLARLALQKPVFRILIQLGQWIRILIRNPDPRGQRHKNRKRLQISCFEVLDVLFWGLKASPVAWMSL